MINEIMVFPDYPTAAEYGFRGRRHPSWLETVAWWPALGGMALDGYKAQRITLHPRVTLLSCEIDWLRSRQLAWAPKERMWVDFRVN